MLSSFVIGSVLSVAIAKRMVGWFLAVDHLQLDE